MKNGESNSVNRNINPVQLAPRLPNAMIRIITVEMIDPVIKKGFIRRLLRVFVTFFSMPRYGGARFAQANLLINRLSFSNIFFK